MSEEVLEGLLPQPRRVVREAGAWRPAACGSYRAEGEAEVLAPALRVLGETLGPGWRRVQSGAADITFHLVRSSGQPQSYRLGISPDGVVAEAGDRAGLYYAAVTLSQALRAHAGELPACRIEDSPDFPARGVMLDVSRDKVPTLATLFDVVERLSRLKVNQLQLYTEHVYAYRGHEEVWRDASPLTADELRALDAHCRLCCVELVPNQNSFGHLERWLVRPRYNVLAELPQGGAPLPWGGVHEKPTSLCPTDPRSLAFLEGLYDDLLPNFSSRLFNVGCDETFDLRGNGRSAAQVREQGEGRVYLEFLKRIHALVAERGRTMQFWGDIIIRHPDLVGELPRDTVALEWGYEADHPFGEHGARFAAAGVPFYVCPGTSSWNSLAGRSANMLANLRSAAEHGLRHGACGYLITDWGDGGHWQPLAVSLPGMAYGACLAWGAARCRTSDAAEGAESLGAEGTGRALLELGDLYRLCGAERGNGTELFQILFRTRERPLLKGVTGETLRRVLARIDEIERGLPASGAVAAEEAGQAARLVRAACRRGLALLEGGLERAETRLALARETDELLREHARVWRLRNREGGLADSLGRLAPVRREYGP